MPDSSFTLSARSTLLLASLLLPCAAQALSYVAMPDASLYDSADLVVSGTMRAADDVPEGSGDWSRYTLEVGDVLKGEAPGESIAVRVPGSRDRHREGALVIPGAPHFDEDETVMLFLNRRADGSYAVAQLALGAFHVREGADGGRMAERDLSEANEVETQAKALTTAEDETVRVRDFARFSAWAAARSAGATPEVDYWTDAPVQVTPKFAIAAQPARWFAFDNGGSITLYAGSSGQGNLSGGGYEEFQRAISAWNNDSGSAINYVYGGTTTSSGGLDDPDGLNAILFNDLLDQIAGVFNCDGGGTIAYGGYRSSGSSMYKGVSFGRIAEADIVVQDGAGCALSGNRRSNAAEVFAHELGHTLGLMHSCGDEGMDACTRGSAADDALMRPSMHADGRGASLSADDRAGIAYLYGASTTSGDTSGDGATSVAPAQGGNGGALGAGVLLPLLGLAALRRRR